MGFDEPVTHSVPATLGPLTEAEEAALRVIGRLERAKVDPQTIKWSRDDLNLLLDAARAATRVEVGLRARIEALRWTEHTVNREKQRGWNAAIARVLELLPAATEAPRPTCDLDGCSLAPNHDGDHNGWWADPATATRVEVGLRARIEAEVVRQRDLIAAEPSSEWRRGALATVEWVAAQIVPMLDATEAPRDHEPWCRKTVGWDDAGSGPDCNCGAAAEAPHTNCTCDWKHLMTGEGHEPGCPSLAATEDRDEPTMKDRARARMHRATPRSR